MTFVAIVHHDIQPGKLAEAQERIDGNGRRMAEQPGYRERYLLHESGGGDELVTVTVWESEETYEKWVAHNRANNPHSGKPTPYVGGPRTSLYTVVSEIPPAN
jgi:heme-degrading monooxygenase HmoA